MSLFSQIKALIFLAFIGLPIPITYYFFPVQEIFIDGGIDRWTTILYGILYSFVFFIYISIIALISNVFYLLSIILVVAPLLYFYQNKEWILKLAKNNYIEYHLKEGD